MGIKENFTQALRELTGGGKETDKKNLPVEELVDELEKAVEAYGAPRPREAAPTVTTIDDVPDMPEDAVSPEAFFAKKDAPPQSFAKTPKQSVDIAPPVSAEPAVEADVDAPAPVSASEPEAAAANTGADRFAGNFASSAFSGFRQRSDTDDTNELTVISRNTIIDGNIRSLANMSIEGHIRGDVETTKNLDMNGKIVGNVTCNNALMNRSQIQGNIRIKGNISMKRDTLLIGDIMSTHAEVNGKIKGNVDVAGRAELKGDAVVFGDISASTITVEDGAIIRGHVSTTSLNLEESRNMFPEAIVIEYES
ncbi:MAG: polymer-forming cytoskeletal protein [Acidobacteriota bacterium]|jgi:cytoskeletal protein CcmA (bactofilin family)|nr:polymer-forming cytoskeletal protein [Acidobacteriota bacterium]